MGKKNRLLDRKGVEIKEGDRLRFFKNDGCVWDGDVIFEDGCLTVSILNAEQVQNPTDWDKRHDWIASRWWSCAVGYGELGTWDCPREPLTAIAERWKSYDEVKPLYERFGWGDRILKVEVLERNMEEAA